MRMTRRALLLSLAIAVASQIACAGGITAEAVASTFAAIIERTVRMFSRTTALRPALRLILQAHHPAYVQAQLQIFRPKHRFTLLPPPVLYRERPSRLHLAPRSTLPLLLIRLPHTTFTATTEAMELTFRNMYGLHRGLLTPSLQQRLCGRRSPTLLLLALAQPKRHFHQAFHAMRTDDLSESNPPKESSCA